MNEKIFEVGDHTVEFMQCQNTAGQMVWIYNVLKSEGRVSGHSPRFLSWPSKEPSQAVAEALVKYHIENPRS